MNQQDAQYAKRLLYYRGSLNTQYGRIEGLSVPRDRNREFQTQLFAPYQCHTGWLEKTIIKMYQSGMSTREFDKFIKLMLGAAYFSDHD
ncbi:putative transposase [Parageobacillus caldoxylosilyticus NBRC 107762]|uniref:Putative transposase n=1 Tax=Parageobacillus caldoxylosilyticus NBRC 107762 TaxID=1220594 RepID=A0A023DAG9_9BACL|nr:putative transposase [Parageobacillus caldoxylosilyticus NBRC 107762]